MRRPGTPRLSGRACTVVSPVEEVAETKWTSRWAGARQSPGLWGPPFVEINVSSSVAPSIVARSGGRRREAHVPRPGCKRAVLRLWYRGFVKCRRLRFRYAADVPNAEFFHQCGQPMVPGVDQRAVYHRQPAPAVRINMCTGSRNEVEVAGRASPQQPVASAPFWRSP